MSSLKASSSFLDWASAAQVLEVWREKGPAAATSILSDAIQGQSDGLLLKELHQLQDQLQSKQDPIKAQETESILKAEIETDIPSEANDQEILDHFENEFSGSKSLAAQNEACQVSYACPLILIGHIGNVCD